MGHYCPYGKLSLCCRTYTGSGQEADLWLITADAEKPIDGREMAIINKNRCMYEYFFIGR